MQKYKFCQPKQIISIFLTIIYTLSGKPYQYTTFCPLNSSMKSMFIFFIIPSFVFIFLVLFSQWFGFLKAVCIFSFFTPFTFGSCNKVALGYVLNCSVQELLPAPQGYSHFYDDKTGEWLGIRKK